MCFFNIALILVSKHETEKQKFSILSQSMRLKGRNSRSRELKRASRYALAVAFI